MKRVGVLICAVLALFLISSVNPSMSSIPAAIVGEAQEVSFFTAADGGESSESITLFSETTDDNTFYRPDYWGRDLTDHMDDVTWTGKNLDAQDTLSDNATMVWLTGLSDSWDSMYSNFPDTQEVVKYWNISFAYYTNTSLIDLWLRLADADDLGSAPLWALEYDSSPTPDTWNSYTVEVDTTTIDDIDCIDFGLDEVNHKYELYIKDLSIWNELDLAQSGYSEPFCSVSDWSAYGGLESFSTDGDVVTLKMKSENNDDTEGIETTGLSIPIDSSTYVEFRYWCNATIADYVQLRFYDSGSNFYYFSPADTTTQTTSKYRLKAGSLSGSDFNTVAKIQLLIRLDNGLDISSSYDYLRIGPADEMGFSHDGSTTAGVTNDTAADNTCTISSDGDILTLNVTRSAGAGGNAYGNFYIAFDTTATAADIENTYYPFFEIRVRFAGLYVNTHAIRPTYDSKYVDIIPTKDVWETYRVNMAAGSALALAQMRFYAYLAPGLSAQWEIEWCKAYSIANCTVTQSGATTDDVLYTDSGVLYSNIDDGYIELNHDPALSVSDTYSVYNLTTSGTAPEFSQYVSEWSAYSDETRGATTSGTVTDIKLKFDSIETISAIKFIEDSTAPAVVRSSSTPNDPEDDETVTLSAVITDAVEVYSVAFNAIVYPTGFSDVDYDATEQANNLWTYEFSSLITGYYCFKIIASDGANDNALTEYAYIELSVREAAIRVEEITLIGAGSDFEMMTFSARINRDCSFTIYEESASSPESDTHTGSVTAPSFNLAWTKLDVDDANVNFTINFVSGSLTYNYTSQYQVAQTTFYVSTVTQMVSLDTVTVTGRITKLGAYQVYDDLDVLKDYGSITDLDFKIQFTRWGGYDEQNHDFAIKFTNGTQTCWYNSSFYAFKKPVVAAFQTTDENALYAFQVSFWTLIAVVAVGGMVAVDFYRKEVK